MTKAHPTRMGAGISVALRQGWEQQLEHLKQIPTQGRPQGSSAVPLNTGQRRSQSQTIYKSTGQTRTNSSNPFISIHQKQPLRKNAFSTISPKTITPQKVNNSSLALPVRVMSPSKSRSSPPADAGLLVGAVGITGVMSFPPSRSNRSLA